MTENKGGIKKEKEYKGDIKKEKEYKGERKSPSVFLSFLLSTLIVI